MLFIICMFTATIFAVFFFCRGRIEYEFWIRRAQSAEFRQHYKKAIPFYKKALTTNIETDRSKNKLSKINFRLGLLSEVRAIDANPPADYYREALFYDSLNYRALMGIARTDTSWSEKIRTSGLAYSLQPNNASVAIHCYLFGKGPAVFMSRSEPADDYWPTIEKKMKEIKSRFGYSFYTSLMLSMAFKRHGNLDSAENELRLANNCLQYSPIIHEGNTYFSPEDYIDSVFLRFYQTEKRTLLPR
jgi:hypothetical protein